MTGSAESPIPYSDDLERKSPDEDELTSTIVEKLRENNERAYKKYRHAIRDAHAKSHGVLRGELTIYPDLSDELRQGLFAIQATYPVIARLSSTAGAIRSDQIRGVRGIAIKILGVHGPRAVSEDHATTQDFALSNHAEFPFADAREYRRRGMRLAWLLARSPDCLLRLAGGGLARARRVLPLADRLLPPILKLISEPNTHILGETFHTGAPLRYGDYVAKISVAPLSASVKRLQGQPVPRDVGVNAHRDMVVDFFRSNSAEYEVCVQLCTDPAGIENAKLPWSSPQHGVAKITFPVQGADSPARRAFADEVLSFNPWRALADHRPLGSINRLKKEAYDASSRFRHQKNNAPQFEPTEIADLPD